MIIHIHRRLSECLNRKDAVQLLERIRCLNEVRLVMIEKQVSLTSHREVVYVAPLR